MATTTNYSWTTPDDTDLVKDGASAIRSLGTAIDTTTKNLNPSTTAGDIEYRSSTTNVNTRLALGTAGQVLTVNSGATAPEWAAPATGGMTLISTTSLTGASITLSSIPATYNNLQLIIQNYKPATDGTGLQMRLNNNTGTVYKDNQDIVGNGSFDVSSLTLISSTDNSVAQGLVVVDIFNYANNATWKVCPIQSIGNDQTTTTNFRCRANLGLFGSTTTISSIVLFPASGNFTSGTALLYGVK